jgi:aldehyde dehydrogenase (NAD+)
MENALLHSLQSFLGNLGQVCVAGSRALVQEGITPHFIESLKARFQKLSSAMGDGMNSATYLGPVADKAQFTRVMSFIEDGKKNGAPLVGGSCKGDTGNFIESTIFLNPPRDSKISREEIFGPVLTV